MREGSWVDWSKALDVDQALKNVKTDLYGDWYRDPWGWPELAWVATKQPDILFARLNQAGVGRAASIDVAKENFGIRPATVMDPIDRLAYQALVDLQSLKLGENLKETVYGWRLPRSSPGRAVYSPNGTENEMYRRHISQFAAHEGLAGLKTDIVSFFSNIPIERLSERIHERSGNSRPVNRLVDMLASWDGSPRKGLPQRSAASAVLANLYLQPLDDALLRNVKRPKGSMGRKLRDIFAFLERHNKILDEGQSARWMDDIWVFHKDEGELRQIQRQVESLLRELGLDINTAKTAVLTGEELVEEVLNFAHSAVEDALSEDPIDQRPLQELIDLIIEAPEATSRSTIRFAFRRMRLHGLRYRLDDLVAIAPRAPHGADAFARLFRDTNAYRDLHSWYVSYWKGSWAVSDWSTATLGTMFPARNVRKPMRELLATEIATPGGSLALTSFAAHRLSAKDPAMYRAAIRSAAKDSSHPLERRALALAALTCGEERAFVRKSLSDFKENEPILRMLEQTNFLVPNTPKDFGGG